MGEAQVFKEVYLKDDLYAPIKEKKAPHIIFICSTTDMWISEPAWIKRVLYHCRDYPDNTYLFQTKAPEEMKGWIFPPNTILGTTLETDGKITGYSMAPEPAERALALAYLKRVGYRTMVSIEPIMDFYLPTLVMYISMIKPEFVSIGADSKGHHLPEPTPIQVQFLIKELRKFTEVRIKPNLQRLMDAKG